jgi:hypothetical protein
MLTSNYTYQMFPAPMMHDENENSQNPRRVQIEMLGQFLQGSRSRRDLPLFLSCN